MLNETSANGFHASEKPAPKKLKTQIVVVGGGAGGLELVRKLGTYYGREDFDIILVERNPTHIWKPLLHEVAAGSLDANLDEVGYRGHSLDDLKAKLLTGQPKAMS